MKKKINLSAALLLFVMAAVAQNNGQINLTKGQKFLITTVAQNHTVTNAMGQEIETSANVSGKGILSVDGATSGSYTLSNTTTAMKINMSMMGQQLEYDSENPDTTNPMAAGISQILNKPIIATINKDGKSVKVIDNAYSDGNIPDLMKQMGGGAGFGIKQSFLVLPKSVKVGDVFSTNDSDTSLGSTVNMNYTVRSINGNSANLTFTGQIKTDMTMNNQGMEIHSITEGTSEGEVSVSLKTGMIENQKSKVKMKGTASVMGQDLPIETEVDSEVTISES